MFKIFKLLLRDFKCLRKHVFCAIWVQAISCAHHVSVLEFEFIPVDGKAGDRKM